MTDERPFYRLNEIKPKNPRHIFVVRATFPQDQLTTEYISAVAEAVSKILPVKGQRVTVQYQGEERR